MKTNLRLPGTRQITRTIAVFGGRTITWKLLRGKAPTSCYVVRILGPLCKLLQEEESRETKASTHIMYP